MSTFFKYGTTLRDLRRNRSLTGEQLAQKTGLSQSKISKIETGYNENVKFSDIEKILNILNAPQTIQQQILGSLDLPQVVSRQSYKLKYPFQLPFELESKAKVIRNFSLNHIPAVLQTLECRQYQFKRIGLNDDDYKFALKATIQRQDLLWDRRHKWHFIICESALYTKIGSHTAKLASLDRLEQCMGLDGIKIGIVPLEAGLVVFDVSSFTIYDDVSIVKSSLNEDLHSTNIKDIADHFKVFGELDKLAHYENDAVASIRKAAAYFR